MAVDAAHFRGLLHSETARLASLCARWEARAGGAPAPPEETVGQIRAVVGKARLLSNPKGRFEQFSGLVEQCHAGAGEKKVTVMDLQGFWDMVYFQVEDVDRMFSDLAELEANGWVPKEKEADDKENSAAATAAARKKRLVPRKRKTVSATAASSSTANGKRKVNPALQQMMAAGRKELEEDKVVDSKSSSLLDVRTPGSALRPVNKSVEKIFEGGFFAVRSPVRRSGGGGASASSSETKGEDSKKLHHSDCLPNRSRKMADGGAGNTLTVGGNGDSAARLNFDEDC